MFVLHWHSYRPYRNSLNDILEAFECPKSILGPRLVTNMDFIRWLQILARYWDKWKIVTSILTPQNCVTLMVSVPEVESIWLTAEHCWRFHRWQEEEPDTPSLLSVTIPWTVSDSTHRYKALLLSSAALPVSVNVILHLQGKTFQVILKRPFLSFLTKTTDFNRTLLCAHFSFVSDWTDSNTFNLLHMKL